MKYDYNFYCTLNNLEIIIYDEEQKYLIYKLRVKNSKR